MIVPTYLYNDGNCDQYSFYDTCMYLLYMYILISMPAAPCSIYRSKVWTNEDKDLLLTLLNIALLVIYL